MSLSLRDLFAAHIAASLATRVDTAEAIAGRSYDLAEAMLRERARRGRDSGPAIAGDELLTLTSDAAGAAAEPSWLDFELGARGGALLDEPAPVSERDDEPDPRWLDREERDPTSYDPRWDAEPVVVPPASARPGLARTGPSTAPQRKEKSA
jgi:hypothetical protein